LDKIKKRAIVRGVNTLFFHAKTLDTMNISCYQKDFPFIVIDDYYSEDEYYFIWEELNFLCYKNKLIKAEGSGVSDDGKPLKNNYVRYLDKIYTDRKVSNILQISRKLFDNNYQIFKSHPSWFFQNVEGNLDHTSLSYYENGEKYLPHKDKYIVTSLWWTCKNPKKFEGGDFIFSDYEETIKFKDNRMIIFPSLIKHEVTPIIIEENNWHQKNGRICLSQFLSWK